MVCKTFALRMTLLLASLACVGSLAAPAPCRAAGRELPALTLEAGSGRLIKLRGRATNVFVADPKIAEVRPASADSLFVFGLAPGHTVAAAVDAAGNSVGQYGLTVMPSGYAARSAQDLVSRAMPEEELRLQQGQDSLTLSGQADSPEAAQQAVSIARNSLDKDGQVFNRMTLPGSIQVNLRVRIAEMSRTLTRELGINWQSVNALGTSAVVGVSTMAPIATLSTAAASSLGFLSRFSLAGRPATLETVIDALSQDQLVHMLAEPNLTTLSGQPASFLVGGEFPIPVAFNNNDITVDFKQYGISLAFVPTVLADGQISLHVRPEVSALTTQGAVALSEGNSVIQIPALTVRRADTTVQLGSGQSFAIAGLLQDTTTTAGLGLPFLGDVPVLGALFRSDSFQHNESELVIVVTPYIVRPADTPAALHLPTDSWTPPNDLDRILLLRQTGRAVDGLAASVAASPPMHVPGDAGFLVE